MEDGQKLSRSSQFKVFLFLKPEVYDFLENDTVEDPIKKCRQVTNSNIYLGSGRTETVEEPIRDKVEEFYKSITKDGNGPMTQTHVTAEGKVTFRLPSKSFNRHSQATEDNNLYVRRILITDDSKDMMPNYLSLVNGVVDSAACPSTSPGPSR